MRSNQSDLVSIRLGPDLVAGERPQAIVPAGAWQSAETLGDWTLVGCTVAPGFEFSGFEVLEPSKGS
jgi:predicted cupin superfamily sugar epimerase